MTLLRAEDDGAAGLQIFGESHIDVELESGVWAERSRIEGRVVRSAAENDEHFSAGAADERHWSGSAQARQ